MNNKNSVIEIPSRVIIEVNQVCTYDCLDCIARTTKPYLVGPSTEDIVMIGKNVVDNLINSISWTGGEPYMKKDFLQAVEEIVNYDKNNIVVQSVDTNGSLITSENAKISSDLFSLARVSIYGSENTFHTVANLPKNSKYSFFDAINAIDNFVAANLPVQINVPVYSLSSLDEILYLIDNKWADESLVEEVVFIPRIDISKKKYDELPPSEKSIKEYFFSVSNDISFNARVFEWKPGKHLVVKADAKAYAHPAFSEKDNLYYVGDPLTESMSTLWRKFPEKFKDDHYMLTPNISHLRKGE